MDSNRSKRFDFLLKQTEIFSHFMPGSGKLTPEKKKSGRKKEEKKQPQTQSQTANAAANSAPIDPAE